MTITNSAALPAPLIGCATCPATAQSPIVGVPDGWQGFFRTGAGWTFVCRSCATDLREKWERMFEFRREADEVAAPVAEIGFNPRISTAPNWTQEEDERLRQAYAAGERIDQVAEELGRTYFAAHSRAEKIGLGGSHSAGRGGWAKDRDWTPEEDEHLRLRYGKTPTRLLADELKRSKGGVYNRAFSLGIEHSANRRPWSEEEQKALRIAFERGVSVADLASAVGRKAFTASKYATGRGYHFGRRANRTPPPTLQQILALEHEPASDESASPHFNDCWSPARQDAFLDALERSGSMDKAMAAIGLSAASKQAAYRARKRHPDFDRRWKDVTAKILNRRRESAAARDEADRRARQEARKSEPHKLDSWSADRQDAFIAALERTGSVLLAGEAVGIDRTNLKCAYNARKHYPEFAARWDAAKAVPVQKPAPTPQQGRAAPVVAVTPPAPASKPAPERAPAWDEERKASFLAALAETGRVGAALQAIGLAAASTSGLQGARRLDPAFALRAAAACAEAADRQREARQNSGQRDAVRAKKAMRTRIQNLLAKGGTVTAQAAGGVAMLTAVRAAQETIETARRQSDPVEQAKVALQRRGRVVYRMSVHGGSADLFFVSGLGKDVSAEQLLEAARRIEA